ncbi:serine hydrolase [Pedobacter soli]|uniref:CubicO group peptidase, beta-lactamase class C family n=1 Tax=Pedobacter soli TaxID=390242 RepID=A0A1G6JXT9_9SPHI|nr:serine hydrolase [Pedobacter soli]SDC22826.1 CubicO group peptidase, beta-lactamase class C family [Pedobacter soli]
MKMRPALVIFVLFPLSLFAQNKQQHQLDSLMKVAHQRGIFNGNILVAKGNKIIYEQSFGLADAEQKLPLSKEMLFDVGSISKEFNGAAIMWLSEHGKLSLDDELIKYFPSFPLWAKTVKIRHLINYTSAIPILGPELDGNDSLILESLKNLKTLAAAPGTVYIYNHINVSLQRSIIEMVSGMNYSTFLQTHIFPAAGMKHARVDYPVDAKGMARAFDEEGKTVPYAQQTKGWVRLPVRDLYKWMITLDAGKVIPASALRELGRNFPGGESSLGTTSFNDDALISHQHQGSNSNYEAAFYHNAKDGISIVMMTNNQQMNVWPLKTAIVHILQNEPFTIPKKSLYLSIRDKILADFSKGMEYYHSLKSTGQQSYDFSFEIGDLISTAKYLQRRGRFDDAISILKAAVVLDAKAQDRSYGYELMGECYEKKGNTSLALESLQTAVSLYPENKNAAGMMLRLKNN